MIDIEQHHAVTAGSEIRFGVFFALAFLLVAAYPMLNGGMPRLWALGISALFLLAILIYPRLLVPLNTLWHKFSMVLGAVISPILLGVLFVIGFVPTGLYMRRRGRDLLTLKFNPDAKSYWSARDAASDADASMRRQF